jgi:hypothetical protein
MIQRTMSDLWLLLCTLVFVGVAVRAYLRLWKRIGVKALWTLVPGTLPYYALRIIVTGIAAAVLAQLASEDGEGLVFLTLWPGLFLLWKYWDRHRRQAASSLPGFQALPDKQFSTPQPQSPAILPTTLVPPKRKQPILRILGKFVAAVVLLLIAGIGMVAASLAYYHHLAQVEHDKIRLGMTPEQVLSQVQNYFILAAYSDAPVNGPDDTSHLLTLTTDSNGLLHAYDLPALQARTLSAQAAAELMHEKLGNGYDWHWRYTFVNDTPQHISFIVTFGPDGRVKELKPVYGWD